MLKLSNNLPQSYQLYLVAFASDKHDVESACHGWYFPTPTNSYSAVSITTSDLSVYSLAVIRGSLATTYTWTSTVILMD